MRIPCPMGLQKPWALANVCHVFIILLVLQPSSAASKDVSSNGLPATDHTVPLWGPYRPGLFFGLRPRLPKSLLMGLMWADSENEAEIQTNLRHTCEHDDGILAYGWNSYDPRTGGSQIFQDAANKIDLTADFIRDWNDTSGDRWGLRLTGKLREDAKTPQRTVLIFYVGSEAKDSALKCVPSPKNPKLYAMHTLCTGEMPSLHNYQIEMLANERQENGKDLAVATISTYSISGESVWPVKSIYLSQLAKSDPSTAAVKSVSGKGNLHLIAMTFTGEFDLDILFSSGAAVTTEPWPSFDDRIHQTKMTFDSKFDRVFRPRSPFNDPEHLEFSKSVFADLMGSIGFYHGKSQVDRDPYGEGVASGVPDAITEERGPFELLTAVPSRASYPRGFLWDDGFHLQVIADWDMDLALEIISSWLNLTDENGWIAREQILGAEAKRKVPPELHTQYQTHATPPTMFMAVEMFVDRHNREAVYNGTRSVYLEDHKAGEEYLKRIYPQLQAYYDWWRRSQSGDLSKYQYLIPPLKENFTEGYRWRGRGSNGIISSGLHDYPRLDTPSEDELHVDALAWVSLMGDIMRKVSIVTGNRYDPAGDAFKYDTHYLKTSDTASVVHWSESNKAYCDATIAYGRVKHNCHKGFTSLLPWVANTLFPLDLQHSHVDEVMDLITDPKHLWTPYGLRSLSTRDEGYRQGERSWRSSIWINMNYLVLYRLLDTAQKDGPHSRRAVKIYSELRKNVVQTVYNSWKETGTTWETYDPITGRGQGSKHFTGWNSLVVKIMAMPSLEEKLALPGVAEQPLLTYSSNSLDLSGTTKGYLALMLVVAIVVFRRRLLVLWRSLGKRSGGVRS